MEKSARAPIVCVLGHVDHGKTTLLDAIRTTNVASKEAGGITQGIGASVVTTKKGSITFIDTPGHAAFSNMRSRGAKVADIAILVVDATAGVKPQTSEAIQLIKSANIPFVVAITKIDLPSANIEEVKGQLTKEGILFEGRGGDTPVVAVSAKESKGLSELLETINLVAEVSGVKGERNSPLEAVVIESSKDKRGTVASIVVRAGRIKVGDQISAEAISGKVRALFNDKLESVREVGPGEPGQVLGFEEVPPVGASVRIGEVTQDLKVQPQKQAEVAEGEIPILIKTKDKGSIEAIEGVLPSLYKVINKGVGDVNESDVLAAKAASARIFVFGSKVTSSSAKLAETEGVVIEKFEIIYELIERLEEILKKGEVEIFGKAEIVATFPFNNKKVAGCKVVSGRIKIKDHLKLFRGDKDIGKVRVISMKKQKEEVTEVGAGEEFGVIFEPQLDFSKGDVLVSVASKK
ncbi:hypothetical protein A2V56_05265 [Candidatus Woesebacteria bacterium RBG_19FT_COMBO_42_9]|uniref:Tr-type G domain-containing protein n=1 Tax=Candidatus Woesebacteria bacterium RBG_16_42_24 TaxID=1802485 RepID=A0A1F7XND2_9BACT|nr:MAG: hypothetical protein A2V97_03875 [Candidatus Woesebacteria bacterium RBG_16_42_24]OGM17290.1 MAG: hypothetical protein A2V56_05265 [Candidatus Woesebacteria bacterium RBG_19FT_COMBO_42_9]OGM68014.1 MAG: hypothetical protein A2985_00920 [Candidatus Woesebacteria bacterium RIFCSPLOWO2_01_FULL_43_11]